MTWLDWLRAAWYPLRDAIERATGLDRLARRHEERRRARLTREFVGLLAILPPEAHGARQRLTEAIVAQARR